jgi:hypothetical protein
MLGFSKTFRALCAPGAKDEGSFIYLELSKWIVLRIPHSAFRTGNNPQSEIRNFPGPPHRSLGRTGLALNRISCLT